MADRHIAKGESLLRLKSLPATKAETLLKLFNETHVEHRQHRDAIAAALEAANR